MTLFNIILLGLVSFFSDASAEMVYPLIPLYLTAVFGATPALVGIIEGIAESLAGLLKVFSGYITDRYRRRKPVTFIGYASGLVYKLALLIAGSWAGILVARVIDRIGKGIRTAPRDSLVSESADKDSMGKAFGIHKALDMAGSAVGILLAYFLLVNVGSGGVNYKMFFLLSVIPALLGLVALVFVKETRAARKPKTREHFWKRFGELDRDLKLYLFAAFVFTLGNSSNAFLLLKAKGVGFTDTSVVLLYFLFNAVAALLSIPFGKASDRIGRKKLLVCGYLIFSAVYLSFAFSTHKWLFIAAFALYGIFTAMTSGVERAMIAEISPPDLKGTMLGLHATVVSIALLPASVIAGFLWNIAGSAAPFILGASLSLAAAVILFFFLRRR